MHDCPRCGQACDCSGDIDDIYAMTSEWALLNCKCDCDDLWDEYEDDSQYIQVETGKWVLYNEVEQINHSG